MLEFADEGRSAHGISTSCRGQGCVLPSRLQPVAGHVTAAVARCSPWGEGAVALSAALGHRDGGPG